MAAKGVVTPEIVRQLIDYDPATGIAKWRERGPEFFGENVVYGVTRSPARNARNWNARHAGKVIKSKGSNGYLYTTILNERHLVHRLCFAHYYGRFPQYHIDHINGDRSDNRIGNLRDVPKTENCKNIGIRSNNKSGRAGVFHMPGKQNPWHAFIKADGKKKHLGCFPTLELAGEARARAERLYGYHDNHGKRPAEPKLPQGSR